MGLLVVKADFTGVYALSSSLSSNIDPFIAEYEKKYLRELLGAELYTLFEADVTSYVPVTAKYLTIFNEINTDDYGFLLHSDGMKKMLLGFLWYEFVVNTHQKHTDTGIVTNSNENSLITDFNKAYMLYNKSIDTFNAIQYYINQEFSTYPEYKGICKRFASSF
jgi:hypothetical protein